MNILQTEHVSSCLGKRNVKEKKMLGGLTFMVNDKMCVGILNDDLMARIDPENYEVRFGKNRLP